MKKLYLILILVVFTLSANAQQHFLVTFKDKGPEAAFYWQHPEQVLSEKALARRQKHRIPLSADDFPVSRTYVGQLQQHGVRVLQKSKWLNAVYVETELTESALKDLFPAIQQVKPYGSRTTSGRKSEPVKSTASNQRLTYGASQSQIAQLGLDCLHDQGQQGKNVLIVVLDTGYPGVNTVSAYDSLRLQNRIVATRNFVDPGVSVYGPYDQHGTVVLSVMAANMPGVYVGAAPQASFALGITEDMSGEKRQEELNWAAGAEWADSLGADILQSSLGYKRFDPGQGNYAESDIDGDTPIITQAADKAAAKGMLVVIAAGNEGASATSRVNPPCDGDSVLCVGSVNAQNVYSSFSSVGPTADNRIKPEVVARGMLTSVVNRFGGVASTSGTSVAAPLISGLAACLLQANPQATSMQIYQAIIRSADKFSNPDNRYGYGLPAACRADSLLKGIVTAVPKQAPVSEPVRVYPTQVISGTSIYVSEQQPVQWELFSITGQCVARSPLIPAGAGHIPVHMQQLSPGLYILLVRQPDGSVFSTKIQKLP